MPLSLSTPKRTLARRLAPWLAGTLLIVLGWAILYWQTEQALQSSARHARADAVAQFESILANVGAGANEILPLAGQPCAAVQLALRDQVTRRPFVRSTSLISDGVLYCSSLLGATQEPVNPADYAQGTLWLMPGNAVTPDRSLLVYRASEGRHAALSTVDGYHLVNALRMLGSEHQVLLRVGSAWLGADGHVQQDFVPSPGLAATRLASLRYPLSVYTQPAAGARWTLMQEKYPALVALVLFLGALAGLLCRWILNRVQSPYHEVQRALHAEEFIPYYQPMVHSADGRWAGVEVLMRWQHPREGLVRPDLFIPYAEESGLIVPMTRSLMLTSAKQLAGCAAWLPEGFHVGINITARHCQEPTLFDDCQAFLAHFAPGQIALTLELTERELIQPTEQTHELFERLHALGVSIAIDDFGTGQSSLSYLQTFNVDFLKIDQSFVRRIGTNALSGHILESIIALSVKLDLQTIAEGVETQEQREYLAAQQVDYLQGYLFARPMPGPELIRQLCQQAP